MAAVRGCAGAWCVVRRCAESLCFYLAGGRAIVLHHSFPSYRGKRVVHITIRYAALQPTISRTIFAPKSQIIAKPLILINIPELHQSCTTPAPLVLLITVS